METSLIGKALDFGSKEYGFESHVSNIKFALIYLIQNLKLTLKHKKLFFIAPFSKNFLFFLFFFKKIGLIRFFLIFKKNKKNYFKIFFFFYKNKFSYLNLNCYLKPSKKYFISFNALKLLNFKLKNSICLISNSNSLNDQSFALNKKLGGRLIMLVSI